MTGARARLALVLLGAAVAVPLASPGPAAASFTTRVVAAATATTASVAPPTSPGTAGSTACVPGLTTSYTVRLSWTASASARVSSYRVTETVGGVARAPVTVSTTSWSRTASKTLLTTVTHQLAVVAVTSYGWTSVPATAVYTC
ncbi:hypothetical protein [Klenkia taihuensis]|uniref:Fibronectin type-III domain-containing protein n=1 Tax=Klenkia taihuensis TaxID=1225127 RepID=A0A1I1H630_9ACTN|nr:hypothetical protein [Klenkia taihuensis]GHE09387.1 hypothetical protein GCM10011381_13970 [Klenkia taihuensis]SFC19032.1 hypothetical protein SAMN05661030_0338 [Klenkia taihuensis]